MTSENFISINFDESSKFRNLRIMTFRKNKGAFYINENNFDNELIEVIDTQNKKNKINLVVIETNKTRLSDKVEEYLINLNKKVLIISKNDFSFKNVFIYRSEKLDNNKLTYFNNDIQYGSKFILKRSLDILLSLCLILFFSPIILFIYALIYIKDRSPVIIKQDRVGLHGEQFNMYKFRTMRNNSHNLRDDLSSLNKRSGPLFKIENDPRIIKGLSFIRTYSLDEIPQLINVLKGQMSLVGPRPLFDNDTDSFDRHYMRRLNVMPGITGLLQINERNTSDFSIWYKYDIEYIENWSLFLDLQIILKTPFAMFSKKIKGL
jgi:lipopolysaccharide/colanic/teichoic acid biosynthesis glycosyltransferase